jgi:mono/diheme cytochrome c family protein
MHMLSVRSHLWLAAVAAGLLFGHGSAVAASAEKGKGLFLKYGCWQCHGTVGQGSGAGLKLAPEPMPYEAFTAFVRNTNRAMPPYREAVLPETDLQDIHAYLETIPKPADYKSNPLLSD